MKKIYKSNLVMAAIVAIGISNAANAQCTAPPTPTISGNSICTGDSAVLMATQPSSVLTGWYQFPYGGNAVATGSVYTTPTLTANTVYYTAQLAPTGTASLTLPNQTSTFSGNVRGYWFTAPADFMITGVRVPTDAGSGNSNIAIVKLPTTPPLFSTTTNTFDVLYLTQNNTSGTGTISVNIPVYTGDIIGVLGNRNDVNSYASPAPFNTTLGSYSVTLTRLGMQFPLSTTAPQDLWMEASGSISRVELYTTLGCLNSITATTVTVNSVPTVSASTSASLICTGNSATLTANGAATYSWSSGSTASTAVVSPTTTTTYTVVGYNGGCESTPVFVVQNVSACTGIDNMYTNYNGVDIYPNPAVAAINVSLMDLNNSPVVEIMDALGKQVAIIEIKSNTTSIDLQDVKAGVYYYKVYNTNETLRIGKFVKQ